MIVVADTSPLRYLVVIERDHLLPALYRRVLIPPSVADELNQPSTPETVRVWMAKRPDWLEIQRPIRFLGRRLIWTKENRKPSLSLWRLRPIYCL